MVAAACLRCKCTSSFAVAATNCCRAADQKIQNSEAMSYHSCVIVMHIVGVRLMLQTYNSLRRTLV